jgi:hypothetical protein
MHFAAPGTDCAYCSCRKTESAKMTGLEVAQAVLMPCILYKCPHCLARFWRLDIQKLIIYVGLVLVTAAILFMLLRGE